MTFQQVLERLQPPPADWLGAGREYKGEPVPLKPLLEPLECTSYNELVEIWRESAFWSDSIDAAFSSMLAVVMSTRLQGTQIWLRLLGAPGSFKTTLCEAIAGAHDYVFSTSLQTGFHSGYDRGGKDASLIPLMDGKTAMIKDGDSLLSNPMLDQILSQLRDVFDGMSRAHYRTGKINIYTGLRISFILAGTSSLRQLNRAALGDRFLDCVLPTPRSGDPNRLSMMRKVIQLARDRSKMESNGTAESQDDPRRIRAMRATIGYVNHLRSAATMERINGQHFPDPVGEACIQMGDIVASMRARPDRREEEDIEVELPTRLSEQFLKFARCLAIVTNRDIDQHVMSRVAKLASDTCYGNTYKVSCALLGAAAPVSTISERCGLSEARVKSAIAALSSMDCVRPETRPAPSGRVGQTVTIYKLLPYTSGLLARLKALREPATTPA
jgi:hypothetical protein